ncbi:MAG: ribosomal L7Ae/L30e/S12e/Gadd45 family protein [Lachnospiraceae bacterium]|nr:ribosomal L7Ae/L30e/S12e/Gadd45 family protein [Lachnospiraceae bacterium]
MMQDNKVFTCESVSKKIYSYIGLAQKAGKAVAGEFLTEKAIQEKRAELVLVSEEASANTRKNFIDSATYYSVPVYLFGGKEELGRAMGKEFRASLAILDKGLATAIMKQLAFLEHEDQRRR